MITPSKISQLNELNIDASSPPSYVYFPIIYRDSNGTLNNGKTNLSNLINGLKNIVTTIAQQAISTGDYEQPVQPSGGGSGGSSDTNLANRVNRLEQAVNAITSSSNYPTHKIVINNGTEDVATYNLPTGPGASSQTVKIISSAAQKPKYQVELTISTITVTGTSLSVGINVVASTQGIYDGGTLTKITASGSFTGGGTSGSLTSATLLNTSTTINNSNSAELTGTLTGSVNAGTNQVQVTVSIVINNSNSNTVTAMASKYGSTTNTGKASTLIS